jgi:dolichol kinase
VDRGKGYNRTVRKLLHIAGGLPALSLPWLPYWVALAGALAALVFGYWLKPRHAWWLRYISKPADRNRNVITGLRGYTVAILLMVLAWPLLDLVSDEAVRFVMFGWLAMSFGDGLAGLVGPGPSVARTVPWNRHKTWWGLLGGIGGAWVAFIVCFATPLPGSPPHALFYLLEAGSPVAVITGLLESLDLPVDDNYVVGIGAPLAALLLALLLL